MSPSAANQAQAMRPRNEVSEQESLQLVRNVHFKADVGTFQVLQLVEWREKTDKSIELEVYCQHTFNTKTFRSLKNLGNHPDIADQNPS